jgi:hypothetical protein
MSDISAAGFMSRRAAPGGGGANVDVLVRNQRRLGMLQTYASDFVTSSPSAAMAMAQSGASDDQILQGATEAVGFANVNRILDDLKSESPEVQRTIYANLPGQVQRSLGQLGYTAPKSEEKSGGRLFGSIPLLGDVTKRALDWGSVPLLGGALEEAQHFGGEALETSHIGGGLNTVLRAAQWPIDQVAHAYRATVYAREEGQTDPGGWSMLVGGWTPSEIGQAWNNTDEDEGYIRPEHESQARRLLDNNDQAYNLAKAVALHKPIEAMIEEAGLEPGSVEATKLVQNFYSVVGTEPFKKAVNEISTGQVSFGRVTTQELFGIDDTDKGLGRYTSGLLDAGFVTFLDPILVAGKASTTYRFGRNAFRLASLDGIGTATRQADLALAALRAREGLDVGHFAGSLSRVTSSDMRLGRNILSWADRVSEGFRTGEVNQMMRDLPDASTAMGHMSDYHVRQLAQDLPGLDTPLGVVEYLQNRDSILAIMGTRVGGASPKVWGLRLPTFTTADRAMASTKAFWQKTVDYSRFAGATPERFYGPKFTQMVAAAGSPRSFSRQAGRYFASKTVGSAGRTMALLTSHVPYRDFMTLTGPDAIPEFTRLTNTGLFAGMSRQTMDDFVNAFVAGDIATRAKIQESFIEELFRRGGIHDTPFAERFLGATREAYALDPEAGSMRLVDVGHADVVAIPDVRGFLAGTYRANTTRMLMHNPGTAWTEAMLGRYWKPSVLLRLGFITRAAGEELLHTMLKYGTRVQLGAVGAGWQARAGLAEEVRTKLRIAEQAGRADEINSLRHTLADLEGSMFVAPIRSLMAGTDRMYTQMFLSSRSDAAPFRRALAKKAERFDPSGKWRTYNGLERFSDNLSLWSTNVMQTIARHTPGELTKARIGEIMAQHWNPAAAEAAHDLLHNPTVARAFAENISGATMTPWEFRPILDGNGVPTEKVTFGEFRNGVPITEEIHLRPQPGESKLDRVLDDPTFYNSLYARHMYTREDRVLRAVTDNVMPRFVGPWADDTLGRLGYSETSSLRGDLNNAWSHSWSETAQENLSALEEGERAAVNFESGQDALGFMRRFIDGEIPDEVNRGWIARRLGDLFDDAGINLSGPRFLAFMENPDIPMAAKRWLLYEWVDPNRLIDNVDDLRFSMQNAARGRLGRPDMYPKLRENRLYAKGEQLALPAERGISKIYVPLMPATYVPDELGDDFIEAAVARIRRIGGFGDEQADTIARNVAAASVNPGIGEAAGRIGMVPLGAWGSADPRVTEAIMAAAEDVTGLQPTFGILQVPDEVIDRSTDRVLQQGVRRAEGAGDYSVDGWRLLHTRPTAQPRRYVTVDVGDEAWDGGLLSDATRAYNTPPAPDTRRMYSTDKVNWSPDVPEGPFFFVDAPTSQAGGESARQMLEGFGIDHLRDQARLLGIRRYSRMKKAELVDQLLARPEMQQTLARAGAGAIPDEVVAASGAKRLPGVPGSWSINSREVSDGLGEITALERTADRSVDELMQTLTTVGREGVPNDVLHEIVEPLLRPTRRVIDPATGVETLKQGYHFDHLMYGTSPERLPTQSYGPRMMAGRDLKWSRVVREWFDGPVNRAISSIVRKPLFLNTYGEQLKNVRGAAELLVDPQARQAVEAWANEVGLPLDDLDRVVRNVIDLDSPKPRLVTDREMNDIIGDHTGWRPTEGQEFPDFDLEAIKRFAVQRHHALTLARDNAINRTMQLTIPYIDDHRIRSAFQNHVGNFIPFLFAEEQFLKRWVRSTIESPEMIRRAQLGMNGLRSMGTVRRDDQGREVFVYSLAGDAIELLSKPIEWITGRPVSLPYEVAMTGDVGYTLPGFGNQMGVPSAGPLVGMATEELSRMFPELAEVEQVVVGRGANRPLWQYLMPSAAAKIWEAGWGDIDKGQLASATVQAIQTMAINGQLPPETATPEERQEFIDRASAQARFILMARGVFGLTAPAAPSVEFEHDELTDEFRALLQADIPFEESIRLYLANHPDAKPADILAATVSSTESDFSGLDMPTDEAFDWVNRHKDLVEAYPAAAAWLAPRAASDDRFSQRAYNQQLAMGLRHRKDPKEFIDDVYFRTAAQDYFDAKTSVEERTIGLNGAARQQAMLEWRTWKDAYFTQHPLFSVMLQDPERQQKRQQAVDQLTALSGRDDDIVPTELRDMMKTFADFQLNVAALRGDRRRAVAARRSTIVGQTAAWMQWQVQHYPWLAGPYLRLIDPELREADEDAVTQAVDNA